MIVDVGRGELTSALEGVTDKITAMVGSAATLEPRVLRSSWTAGQAAAHVAISQELFATLVTGGSHPYDIMSPDRFASVNARLLAEAHELVGAQLAERIHDATRRLLTSSTALGDDVERESPLGVMSITTLLSYSLCHLLSHGHAMAKAVGAASPILRSHARLAIPFLEHSTPVAYAMQPRRIHARVAFRVRRGPRFTVSCNETASMGPEGLEPVDATLSVDAAAMLRMAFGLESVWLAAARGELIVWGRRPWVAVRVKGLLPSL
jgi:hypothetical protein